MHLGIQNATMLRFLFLSMLFVAECTSIGPNLFADEPPRRFFTLLPDASHWLAENCTADFTKDGVIRGAKGNGWVRSVYQQRDFVLELDWKPERAGAYDSGIFFRTSPPVKTEPWPDFFQVNLKSGAEGILKNVKTESFGPAQISHDEWNHLKLVVAGGTAACEINGIRIWNSTHIEDRSGILALQVEEPKGGVVLFQNVKITETGFENLIAEGLDGWSTATGEAADGWVRRANEIVCTGAKGPWLRFHKTVEDFNLRLEYLLREGGNSGVYIRVPDDGAHHGAAAGIEVQILDDYSARYTALKPYQYSGSLYAIVPADPRSVIRPTGQWNSLEIDCRGDQYVVIQNGVEIIRASGQSGPELLDRRLAGYIGLQNHSEEVRFRNIRLGPSQY